MNTQQMQAACQAVTAVTQLREKANTRSYKVRPQERRDQCISTVGSSERGIAGQEQEACRTAQPRCLLENKCREQKSGAGEEGDSAGGCDGRNRNWEHNPRLLE